MHVSSKKINKTVKVTNGMDQKKVQIWLLNFAPWKSQSYYEVGEVQHKFQ